MNPPATKGLAYQSTNLEQLANILTHGIWIVPAFYALRTMVKLSITQKQSIVAWWYGISLISLFLFSTGFHVSSLISGNESKISRFLHFCDRSAIFTFIATCYMPWYILNERLSYNFVMKWTIFIWLMAVFGVIYTYKYLERYKSIETLFYVIIGVMPSIPILLTNKRTGAWELSAGGWSYILGIIFFKSDGRIPFAHAIWHMFVAFGALCHCYAAIMYKY